MKKKEHQKLKRESFDPKTFEEIYHVVEQMKSDLKISIQSMQNHIRTDCEHINTTFQQGNIAGTDKLYYSQIFHTNKSTQSIKF